MLTFQPENKPVKNMTYDENGNMTSVTNSCGTTTYTWDVRNRLVGISGFDPNCQPLTASFKYDALGRRIQKKITHTDTVTDTMYLYDGLDIIQEIKNGMVYANYIRTLNIDEPLARIKADGSVRYYQQDALGSVIALTDEAGIVKTTYAYDPFGAVTVSGKSSDNPFQYTGRENDGTGLYYYRARYYSPELQRFISEDPIGLAGGDINFYAYVGNSPINRTDPLGYVWLVKKIIKEVVKRGVTKLLKPDRSEGDSSSMAQQEMEKDSDGDGITDYWDPDSDYDRDGIPNFQDPDDDNDGVDDGRDFNDDNSKPKPDNVPEIVEAGSDLD